MNDRVLDQTLLEAFLGDFDLCADFKRSFVYRMTPNHTKRSNELGTALPGEVLEMPLRWVLPDLAGSSEIILLGGELENPYTKVPISR